ncbi:hypothetical protein PCASD_22780 [Puccinia coronata f. sp. avenae]|uniref:Uncharacterized protein n=1 Tax=Puccinia coronata f. sp. avenae TaxID=200324 RepID=A0A2N5TJ38_9BASI|nr:hypothetical protein PCASD_22780 [Puccinia coronata f. sp. avenae]
MEGTLAFRVTVLTPGANGPLIQTRSTFYAQGNVELTGKHPSMALTFHPEGFFPADFPMRSIEVNPLTLVAHGTLVNLSMDLFAPLHGFSIYVLAINQANTVSTSQLHYFVWLTSLSTELPTSSPNLLCLLSKREPFPHVYHDSRLPYIRQGPSVSC